MSGQRGTIGAMAGTETKTPECVAGEFEYLLRRYARESRPKLEAEMRVALEAAGETSPFERVRKIALAQESESRKVALDQPLQAILSWHSIENPPTGEPIGIDDYIASLPEEDQQSIAEMGEARSAG